MKSLIYFIIAVLLGLTSAKANQVLNDNIHTWILVDDSAVEINDYLISKCVHNTNTYCSYWTTTNFGVHSMPDNVFKVLVEAGYFNGQDYNRKYIP